MIIDIHTHIENYNNEDGFDHRQRVKDLKKSMKNAGIDKAVILQDIDLDNPLTPYQLLELVRDEPDLYMMTSICVTDRTTQEMNILDDVLRHDKVVGLKLYPGYEEFYPNDDICQILYGLCEKNDKPVMFHSGDTLGSKVCLDYAHPRHIDALALERPDLKIIIAHLGNPFLDHTKVMLSRHENVYADLSGLTLKFNDGTQWEKHTREKVNELISWCGCDKLLFGTDWFCDDDYPEYETFMKEYVDFVTRLYISQEEEEKIFYKNAMELFKL